MEEAGIDALEGKCLEDVFDLCIGAAHVLGAVMLNGGVGSGARNCRKSGASLCMFADCHTYWY